MWVNTTVEVDLDDVINDMDTEDLIDELQKRGFAVTRGLCLDSEVEEIKKDISSGVDSFKRMMCRILELNYYVSDDTVMKEVKSRLTAKI